MIRRGKRLKELCQGAYELSVDDNYAEAVASYIEHNWTDMVSQAIDMIVAEAKQNSGRLVDIQKGRQKPHRVESSRLWKRILERHKKGIRARSGPGGQGRPMGAKSAKPKYSKEEVADRISLNIRTLENHSRENVARALGMHPKALYRLQRAYGETRTWKEIVAEEMKKPS